MKIYCIISKESIARMKGIRGKMMAQAGHAFLHAYWDSLDRYPENAQAYRDSQHARKIVVTVDTDQELIALYEKYRNICGATKVIDAGFTVFNEPTLTCIGIGPIQDIAVEDDIRTLKLLT